MDFRITTEEREIERRAEEFAEEFLAPYASLWDKKEIFPEEALKACAKAGLTGLTVPKEAGGPGASKVAYALTIMKLAEACSSTAVTVAVTSMVAETIAKYGSPEQIARYIPKLLSGEFVSGSFGLSEANAGSDAASLKTKGVFEGDELVINGEKMWITSGSHSGVFVVWIRTEDIKGANGISTYLVEPDDPGFSVGRKEQKMGLRASTTVSLLFDNCRIPQDRLLGTRGKGFRIAMSALDGGRIGVASQALGIAQHALKITHRYLKDHQKKLKPSQEHRLSEMLAQWHSAKLMILRAAWLKDQGKPFSRQAAMAKAYSTEVANNICQFAVTLLGPDGTTDEYPVERLFRDCKVTTIYEGTSEVQRIVISRSLLKN